MFAAAFVVAGSSLQAQESALSDALVSAQSAAAEATRDKAAGAKPCLECGLGVGGLSNENAPVPTRLKPGMEPFLDAALRNDGVVAALGRLYLYNKNERIVQVAGGEEVTEHYATAYSAEPHFGNYKSFTQRNELPWMGGRRGSVVPEISTGRFEEVVFLIHGHPRGTSDFPSFPQDFSWMRDDLRGYGFWSVVVTPTDIFFMGPKEGQYYVLPAAGFIKAGEEKGVFVSLDER